MTYNELIRFFRTQTNVARFLHVSQGNVAYWKKKNEVPIEKQFEIEERTKGMLQATRPWRKRSTDTCKKCGQEVLGP